MPARKKRWSKEKFEHFKRNYTRSMGVNNIVKQTGMSNALVTRLLRYATYDDYIADCDKRNEYSKRYQQEIRGKKRHSKSKLLNTPVDTPFTDVNQAITSLPKHLTEVSDTPPLNVNGPVILKEAEVDYTPHTMEDYQRENKMLRERLEELSYRQRQLDTAIVPNVLTKGSSKVTEIEMKGIKIIVTE